MCRKPIYFKGFSKFKEEWEQEKTENMYEEVYHEIFDAMLERDFVDDDDDDEERLFPWAICDLEEVQTKFNKLLELKDKGIIYSYDEIADILSSIFLDVIVNKDSCKTDDTVYRYVQFVGTSKVYKRINRGAISKFRTKKVMSGVTYELVIELLIE
jgi:hypothetical protein